MTDSETAPAAGPTEAELRAILTTHTSIGSALGQGFRLAAATAPIGLPVALAYAAVSTLGGLAMLSLAEAALSAEPAMVELAAQVSGAVAAFFSLYALVQFTKRATASRASWAPALLAVPSAMVSGALFLVVGGQSGQLGPMVPSLMLMGWALLFGSFGGGAAAIAWLRAGKVALDGGAPQLSTVLDEVRSRTLEVAAPHGARIHAVTIGMQLLLPGIFYALQLAFTDMVAVLDPERPALKRSGQITFGMRGRLFRLLLLWWGVTAVITNGLALVLEGAASSSEAAVAKVFELMLDPSAVGPLAFGAQELVWALAAWVLELVLLVLYLERERQAKAKTALKQLRAAAAG